MEPEYCAEEQTYDKVGAGSFKTSRLNFEIEFHTSAHMYMKCATNQYAL